MDLHILQESDMMKEEWKYWLRYPELKALVGVDHGKKWHPEGDAFNHTMLVYEQALKFAPDDPILHLAALCHDMGKGLTPKSEWPRHYGHAQIGMVPAKNFLKSMNQTPIVISEVLLHTKYHMHAHNAFKMKGSTYKKIYDDYLSVLGATHVKCALERLCILSFCDHFGRGGVDLDVPYLNPDLMREIFNKLSQYVGTDKEFNDWVNYLKEYYKNELI